MLGHIEDPKEWGLAEDRNPRAHLPGGIGGSLRSDLQFEMRTNAERLAAQKIEISR